MRSEDIKYVIIQAGGKGIRMGRYAENKPKCLVPVKGIPMIMNTIEKYKDKENNNYRRLQGRCVRSISNKFL